MRFTTALSTLLCRSLLVATFLFSGCQSKPLAIPPVYHSDLADAVNYIADTLAMQISPQDLKNAKEVPVDLFFNEHSADEATSSKVLQRQMIAAMSSRMQDASFLQLNTQNIQHTKWVALAGYTNVKSEEAGKPGNWVRLKIVLADVKTGTSVARVVTYLDAKQFDATPTRFFKDAPMYLTDVAHQERNAVLSGDKRPLGDGMRLRAELGEAIKAYETGQYADAETRFIRIVKIAPSNTGALSGLYQALWAQGKKSEAEKVFGQLVAVGIDAGKLSIKLLFKLNSIEFIEESDLSQQYQIWLKAIAKIVAENKTCLNITGHASASGSVDYNEKLSLSRASRIVSRMQRITPSSDKNLTAFGKGSSEAIVGTGENNATDAIDRRVEFAVRSCD